MIFCSFYKGILLLYEIKHADCDENRTKIVKNDYNKNCFFEIS